MAPRITTLEEHEARLEELCRDLGIERLPVPANAGGRRTPSKRALLQAIADICREQGREPPFKAAL